MEVFRKLHVDANCKNPVKLVIIWFEMATTVNLKTHNKQQQHKKKEKKKKEKLLHKEVRTAEEKF